MPPATVAGAVRQARAGRGRGWDRDTIINAIQEWVATYGEPPRAADWNPSSAKWSGQLWRVERYRARRADGSSWPALNAAKRPFGVVERGDPGGGLHAGQAGTDAAHRRRRAAGRPGADEPGGPGHALGRARAVARDRAPGRGPGGPARAVGGARVGPAGRARRGAPV